MNSDSEADRQTARPKRLPLRRIVAAVLCLIVCGLPQFAVAQLNEARTLMQDGRNDEAMEVLERAMKDAKGIERAKLLNALGWVNFMEGRSGNAAALYDEALAEAEEAGDQDLSTRIKNNIGINHYVDGNLDAAEAAFVDAAAEGSEVAERYLADVYRLKKVSKVNELVKRGVDARMAGAFEEAVEQYTNALRIDPSNPRALEFRGYAYLRIGDLEKSRDDLEKSFGIDPNRLATIVNLLKVSCAEGNRQAYDAFVKESAEAITKHAASISGDPELRRMCGTWTATLPSP